jgi:hypothetical protein
VAAAASLRRLLSRRPLRPTEAGGDEEAEEEVEGESETTSAGLVSSPSWKEETVMMEGMAIVISVFVVFAKSSCFCVLIPMRSR